MRLDVGLSRIDLVQGRVGHQEAVRIPKSEKLTLRLFGQPEAEIEIDRGVLPSENPPHRFDPHAVRCFLKLDRVPP